MYFNQISPFYLVLILIALIAIISLLISTQPDFKHWLKDDANQQIAIGAVLITIAGIVIYTIAKAFL